MGRQKREVSQPEVKSMAQVIIPSSINKALHTPPPDWPSTGICPVDGDNVCAPRIAIGKDVLMQEILTDLLDMIHLMNCDTIGCNAVLEKIKKLA